MAAYPGAAYFRAADDLREKAALVADILAAVLPPGQLAAVLLSLRYSPAQPRDPKTGRFLATGATAAGKARELIDRIKAGGGGPAAGRELHDHLNDMTVAQLRELKREYGVKGAGPKSELTKKLADRIHAKLTAGEGGKTGGDKVDPPAVDYMQKNPDHPVAKAIREDHESRRVLTDFLTRIKPLADAAESGPDHRDVVNAEGAAHRAWLAATTAQAGKGKPAYKEKMRAAADDLLAKSDALRAAHNRAEDAKRQLAEEGRKELAALIAPKSPLKVEHRDPAGGPVSPRQAAVLADAQSFVASVTNWGGPPVRYDLDAGAGYEGTGRPFYTDHYGGTPTIGMGEAYLRAGKADGTDYDRRAATTSHVHELGHMVEQRKPGVLAAAQEFLAYRVGNEPPTEMNERFPGGQYLDGERGRKDNFDRAFDEVRAYYVGKKYYDAMTEVVSMGVEKLHDDAAGLARKDPEYFQFLVSVLRK